MCGCSQLFISEKHKSRLLGKATGLDSTDTGSVFKRKMLILPCRKGELDLATYTGDEKQIHHDVKRGSG